METLAEQPVKNQNQLLRIQERHKTDTETWLAETLHGSMRTSFEYQFDGQELYAQDGGAMGEVFEDAISQARLMVQENPFLSFELRRRLIEYGEYQDMLKMAKGELPNTMVVVSDFPEGLMGSQSDVGGYNTSRKQTMLRVIARQADGSMRITSQSLDGSNRQALEAIYGHHQLRAEAHTGELLEQRVHLELPEIGQKNLTSNLTNAYDESMARQFEGKWHAGIKQTPEHSIMDTYQFVLAQSDLIGWFVEAKLADPVAAEKQRFKLAATINERYKRQVVLKYLVPGHPPIDQKLGPDLLVNEIAQATDRAIAKGETFSGCGITIKGEADSMLEDQLEMAGYGNKSDEDKYGSLHFKCQKGHNNTRPRGKLIEKCQKCGISVRC